jgi:hypothetical protein
MSKYLYCDFWREGLHSVTEIQLLKEYCIKNDITDLFVQYKKDKATVKRLYNMEQSKFDYLSVAKSVLPKIHIWLPILLLYREKHEIEVAQDLPKIKSNGRVYIDPIPKESRKYIIDYVNGFLKDHDSIHLDRFWYPLNGAGNGTPEEKREALTDIILNIRKDNPTKYISIYVLPAGEKFGNNFDGYNDYKLWLKEGFIDKVWIKALEDENMFDELLQEAKSFTDCVIININQQHRLTKCDGMNIGLYSYGVRSGS